MYTFPVVIQSDYDLSHIYPPVQKYVKQLLDHLPVYIDKVIIFGSSVDLRWGTESDLDVLLITQEPPDRVLSDLSTRLRGIKISIDFVIKSIESFNDESQHNKNSISYEAQTKGVCVYERAISAC